MFYSPFFSKCGNIFKYLKRYMQSGRKIVRKDDELIKRLNKRYADNVVPYMGNSNLPTVGSTYQYDADRLQVWGRCKDNILYFAQHFFYIITDGKRETINLHPFQRNALRTFRENKKNIMCTSRQIGKALAIETPIPTPNGWTTMGELKDGDVIYDNNGSKTNVIKAWDVMHDRPCYKITFCNGEEIVADEEHLWMTETFNGRRGRKNKSSNKKKTTKDILDTLYYKNGNVYQPNHAIKLAEPIVGNGNDDLEIHPYILGLWLGDGYAHEPKLCVGYQDIEIQKSILGELGYIEDINYTTHDMADKGHMIISFIGNIPNKDITMRKAIRDLNIFKNKHIPQKYLRSSIDDRKLLLQGIMDTDGSITNTMNTFYNTNKAIINDVRELLMTLGIKYNVKDIVNENFHKGKQGKDIYRLHFKSKFDVFKILRKIKKQKITNLKKGNYVYIRNIEPVNSVPVRCITVDSTDAVFMCGKSGIVTSNTTLMTIYALWLVTFCEYQSVIIVANKEKTAKEILERIKTAYEGLPNWLKAEVARGGWNKEEILFQSKSKIQISATSADSIRGKTCNCVDGSTVVTIRDKHTGDIFDINMENLYNILESDGEDMNMFLVSE